MITVYGASQSHRETNSQWQLLTVSDPLKKTRRCFGKPELRWIPFTQPRPCSNNIITGRLSRVGDRQAARKNVTGKISGSLGSDAVVLEYAKLTHSFYRWIVKSYPFTLRGMLYMHYSDRDTTAFASVSSFGVEPVELVQVRIPPIVITLGPVPLPVLSTCPLPWSHHHSLREPSFLFSSLISVYHGFWREFSIMIAITQWADGSTRRSRRHRV